MRAVLLSALMLIACSKKSDTKQEAPAASPPAQPSDNEPAEPTPPSPAPAEEKPAPPPAASVDCAALVTADDFQKACNAKVEIGPSQLEGKGNLMTCSRSVTEPGKKFPIARWTLSTFPDAAAAQSWLKLEKTDESKPVADIGDEAWTSTHATKGLESTDYNAGVRKGGSVLRLTYTVNSLNKKPPCTLDQLVEVARLAAARLP